MRIIAGELKGRRLDSPGWEGLRPTSDRLRETLFNVLGPAVRGAQVLDGYAGTGAVGLEALSRGAAGVTFVESDPRAVRLIEANLRRCAVADRHAIIRARFADAVPRVASRAFDIIFLDPPYGAAFLDSALRTAAPLVAPGARLVVEHARRDPAPAAVAGLRLVRTIGSGDSALAFYTADAAPEGSATR
jgi:16S rRNA (guanine(966)-N(2))-methyltransferase RsmD